MEPDKTPIPLRNRVLIEIIPVKEGRSAGGIFLPATKNPKSGLIKGRVLALGIDAQGKAGYEEGDVVYVHELGTFPFEENNTQYAVVSHDDIWIKLR